MRTLIARASAIAAVAAIGPAAANPFLSPGLYQVEVRITLPNVQDAAAPVVVTRCVSPADLESGKAFSVLSDNPLRNCDLLDYQLTDGAASYRIACPGPNRGSAVAVFETTATTYRGTIAQFARWTSQSYLPVEMLAEGVVAQFLGDHLPRCDCQAPVVRVLGDLRAACGQLVRLDFLSVRAIRLNRPAIRRQ